MGPESSLNKVFWSEMDIHLHETALRLLEGDADLDGGWMRGYQFALAGPGPGGPCVNGRARWATGRAQAPASTDRT